MTRHARRWIEFIIERTLFLCAAGSVAITAGIIGVLLFETNAEGNVASWRIGVPPQVDYVEGCS